MWPQILFGVCDNSGVETGELGCGRYGKGRRGREPKDLGPIGGHGRARGQDRQPGQELNGVLFPRVAHGLGHGGVGFGHAGVGFDHAGTGFDHGGTGFGHGGTGFGTFQLGKSGGQTILKRDHRRRCGRATVDYIGSPFFVDEVFQEGRSVHTMSRCDRDRVHGSHGDGEKVT